MARGLYAALAILFLILCGCGGSDSNPATLSSVRVTPSSATLAPGSTTQFRATGTYSDGTVTDITASATWSSSSPAVATVGNTAANKGVATAVAAGGSTRITATYAGVSGSATLTTAQLQSIAVTPAGAVLIVGESQGYRALGTFSNGATQDVTSSAAWSSVNPAVVSVSSRGVATARAAGATQLRAALGTASGSAAVTVVTLTSMTLEPAAAQINLGSNQQFSAIGTLSNGDVRDVTTLATWRSADPAAVSITAGGSATGLLPRTTTVSATVSGVTSSTTVTVRAPQSITVTPANSTAVAGSTQQFTATGLFEDNSTRDLTRLVTWSSSTPAATVSNASATRGLATAATAGSSVISATVPGTGVSGSTNLTVKTLASLAITPSTSSMALGSTRQLTATATFTDGTTQDVSNSVAWSSSAPGIVSVSDVAGSKGLASANALGNATITARLGNVRSATTTVTVTSGTVVTTRNKAFVSNFGSNTVSVIDTAQNVVTRDIPVGTGPQGIAINPSSNRAYVANSTAGTVSVIDIANDVVVATINVGGGPWNLALNPATNRLYVTNGTGNYVSVIDTTNNNVLLNIPAGANPKGVAVNSADNLIYVTNFNANSVWVIDGATNTMTETLIAGQGPFDVAVNTARNTFYVSNSFSNFLTGFDGRNNDFVANIPIGNSGQVVAIDPSTGIAYVALRDLNTVAAVNTTTNTFVTTAPVGVSPRGVAVKSSAQRLYVTNNGSNDIWVLDSQSLDLITTVTGFIGPTYIAVVP